MWAMDTVDDGAARAIIRDLDGRELPLQSLWSERPAVVVFLRHFGCVFCREHAAEFHRQRDAIRAEGAELSFVGPGNRHFAKGFAEEFHLDEPVYVDTKREAYQALDLKRGMLRTLFSPATWRAGLRAMRAGFRQGRTQGDPWQLGGVLVVRPGGQVAYFHRSQSAGDHAPADDVVRALSAR